jgi:hypothetical protein
VEGMVTYGILRVGTWRLREDEGVRRVAIRASEFLTI